MSTLFPPNKIIIIIMIMMMMYNLNLFMRKHQTNPNEGHSTEQLPVNFKTVNIITVKHCFRLKKDREI